MFSITAAGVESSKSNEECIRADDECSKSSKKSEPVADESKPGLERDDSVIGELLVSAVEHDIFTIIGVEINVDLLISISGTESKSTVIECIDLAKMPDSEFIILITH